MSERTRERVSEHDYDGRVSNETTSRSSRDVILDVAQTLVSTRGYDGMVISELSAQSGLPASSIYYHFGSKLGVLAALLERASSQFHASFPDPSSFDGHPPLERFELWFTAASMSLDSHPQYLRLLLAVVVGSHSDADDVRSTVNRIRSRAHESWIHALTPIFDTGSDDSRRLIEQLAVLGRALTDGLSVSAAVDGTTYASHIDPFVALIRSLAQLRGEP